MRNKLLIVISGLAFAFMFAVPRAHADTVDFSDGGATGGSWSWNGTTISGTSAATITVTVGATTLSLTGSVMDFTSGNYSSGTFNSISGATFGSGGSIDVTQGTSGDCGGPCFSGTFTNAQVASEGSGQYIFTGSFVLGTIDSTLLADLGLPSSPASYSGSFTAHLDTNNVLTYDNTGCRNANGALAESCGSTGSYDLRVNPVVPEPGSLALFGTGLLGIAGFLRRKLFNV